MKLERITVGYLSTNCYLIADESGAAMVVDPGDQPAKIIRALEEAALTPERILITHAHFDHVGASLELQKVYGCPVYAAADEVEASRHDPVYGRMMAPFYQSFLSAFENSGHSLADGDRFALGSLEWQVIRVPGHSVGSLCYYCASEELLLSGDTLFRGCIGREDYFVSQGGEPGTLSRCIAGRLLDLPDDTRVCPGHGEETSIGYEKRFNPFLLRVSMEKKRFVLEAPSAWAYELSTLVREVWPFGECPEPGALSLEEADGQIRISDDGMSGELLLKGEAPRRLQLKEDGFRFPADQAKNRAKQLLFGLMEDPLPWGILTGVRPTKVAYAYLERGLSPEETERVLTEEYCLRPDKAVLCTKVACHERKVLSDHLGTDTSIYVGVPFCPTRCAYCSFISNDRRAYQKFGDSYVDCLLKEIASVGELLEGRRLMSFYMGGGTPTTLSADQLDRVLSACSRALCFPELKEITVEAGRPDTITAEKLEVLRHYGVGRISVNPQTMHQETLDRIGRRHSVEDIYRAFELVRAAGFPVINMDFIVGLPGETPEMVRKSMEAVISLRPENLTVHTLAIKRASALNEEKSFADLREEAAKVEEMLSVTADAASRLGMEPYYMYRQKNMAGNFENVGYSLPGCEGLYNIEIMEERQTILALGAGGISKVYFPEENRVERIANVKTADEYIRRLDEMIERKREGGIRLER